MSELKPESILKKCIGKDKFIIAFLLGMILLVACIPSKSKETTTQIDSTFNDEKNSLTYRSELEEELKTVLSKVSGVGQVDVMITFDDNEDESTEGFYSSDSEKPKVLGVVVVAQGGDNTEVIRNISDAVKALFNVEAHKIKVMKMS